MMKKEVKEVKNIHQRENLYLYLLNLLKQGKRPSEISKELGISKQNLNYYTTLLKNEGAIRKKGYGVWEVVKEVKIQHRRHLPLPKEIRGHAFIWSFKIPKEIRGLKDRALLIGKKLNNGVIQLFIKDRKVWVGKKTITIYEHLSFYGRNSIESRKYAVISVLEIIDTLERKLGVSFKPYVLKPKREHYGMIRNDLAIQCNRNNEKIVIRDNLEGEWLWIDDSLGIGELETGGTKALVRSKQVQKWFNDMKATNFEWTPSKIGHMIGQVTGNQMMFAENMKSHISAVQELGSGVKSLTEQIRQLTEQVLKLKEENKRLRDGKL